MFEKMEKEMKSFIADLRENIKDPKELEFLLDRTEKLYDVVFNEMERIVDEEEKKVNACIQKQKKQEQKINEVENKIQYLGQNLNTIYNDIYDDELDEFEIICPYCNYTFDADINENTKEVMCPECDNIIELDWSRDNDKEDGGCNGNCSNCNGCEDEENEDDE